MRRRLFTLSLVVSLVVGVAHLVRVCWPTYEGKRLVLEWADARTGATFRVTEDPGAIVKQNSRLHVARGGREASRIIDDDAVFTTVAFVRYEHWLLVVCRGADEVWAGYDYDAGRLYGDGEWSLLPFTRWSGQGTVVAVRRLRDGDSIASPAQFPRPPSGP